MIRKNNKKRLFFIVDLMFICFSFPAVHYYYVNNLSMPIRNAPFALVIALLWFFIGKNVDSQTLPAQSWIQRIVRKCILEYSLLTSGVIFLVAAFGEFRPNYKIILYALLFSCLFSILFKIFYILSARKILTSDKYQKKIMLIGCSTVAQDVFHTIIRNSKMGYKISCVLSNTLDLPDSNIFHTADFLGHIKDFEKVVITHEIDEVIIAVRLSDHQQILELTRMCEYQGVRSKIVPDFYHILKSKLVFEELDNIPLISLRTEPLNFYRNRILKRSFDILFSFILLILLSPLFIFIGLAIKLTSPGKIIFTQTRISANNKEFEIFKFRSMTEQRTNQSDTTWTTKEDVRVTTLGNLLRRTNLDELPQFWNVILGQMSIVGPRPERGFFVERFKEEIPSYKVRHLVKSGITGWAQVNGFRGDTCIKKRIEHDLHYIENWSIWLDIKIIFLTVFGNRTNKNAY